MNDPERGFEVTVAAPVDDWSDALMVVTPDHVIINTFGIGDEVLAGLEERWRAWWETNGPGASTR